MLTEGKGDGQDEDEKRNRGSTKGTTIGKIGRNTAERNSKHEPLDKERRTRKYWLKTKNTTKTKKKEQNRKKKKKEQRESQNTRLTTETTREGKEKENT